MDDTHRQQATVELKRPDKQVGQPTTFCQQCDNEAEPCDMGI